MKKVLFINKLVWTLLALSMIIACMFSWENYTFGSFLVSILIHGGGSFVMYFNINEIIREHYESRKS